MILVDLNQVMISNLMMQIGNHTNIQIEPSLIRHMVLNSLRSYRQKYRDKYGELVICCDNRHYWRKTVFPYYKASRKKTREASDLDWTAVFETLNVIRDELKDNFPYKVINIDGAEADDVIGTLARKYHAHENILVLSGDKDFMQLQRYPNIDQFSPIMKRWLRTDDANAFLKEHIIKGDRGDGIPNFLSPDDVFVTAGSRQKPVSKKKLDTWVSIDPEQFCSNETMLRNYKRNEQLIDLTMTPQAIVEDIVNTFENYEVPPRSGLLNYFMKNKMKLLMDHLQEF
jgi:hypothetical protein